MNKMFTDRELPCFESWLSNHLSHISHNTTYFRDLLRENGTRIKIPEMMEMVVLVARGFLINDQIPGRNQMGGREEQG